MTGAVAERLGGFGHVCSTYTGTKCPPLEATRMFNFTEAVKATMSTASLTTLLQYQQQAMNVTQSTGAQSAAGAAHQQQNGLSSPGKQQVAELNSDCMRDVQNVLSESPQQAVVEQLVGNAGPLTGTSPRILLPQSACICCQ